MAGERSVKIKFIADKVNKFVADTVKAGGAMERWERQADRMNKASARLSVVTKSMIAPGAVPAVAALALAGVAAGAALTAGGVAMGVFGAVAKTSQATVSDAATKVSDLTDKMDLYGKQARIQAARGEDNAGALKKQSAAALELQARLKLLPAPVAAATAQYLGMQRAWQTFVEKNQPATFGILTRGYALIRKSVGALQPLFDIGARAAGKALTALEGFSSGGGLKSFIALLSSKAGPALDSLGKIIGNTISFVGSLFKLTISQGQGVLDVVVKASDKLAAFGKGGGLEALLNAISQNGPGAGAALVQIGKAAVVIAQALGPLAPITVAIATALAAIIAALPPPVITTLVAAWIAYTAAMTAYNAIMVTVTAATKVWAAVQTALNFILAANPVGIVIIAVVALIAIIVLIATKTTWFQDIWKASWNWIKSAAGAVASWFTGTILPSWRTALGQLGTAVTAVKNFFVSAWNLITAAVRGAYAQFRSNVALITAIIKALATAVSNVVANIKAKFSALASSIGSLRSRISSASSGLFDGIKNAFRNAVNYIIDGWNRLSFTLPSINTPFGKIGGTTLSTPNIGRLASGGWMQPGKTYLTGENGPELLTSGRRAYVNNAGDTAAMGGGTPEIHVYIGDRELTDMVDVRIETSNRQLKRRVGARAGAFA